MNAIWCSSKREMRFADYFYIYYIAMLSLEIWRAKIKALFSFGDKLSGQNNEISPVTPGEGRLP
jgi:hypothetical protein